MNVTPEIEARMKALIAKHPSAFETYDNLVTVLEQTGMDPELYCELTEMQFAVAAMVGTFIERRIKPDNYIELLMRVSGMMAAGIGTYTSDRPLMDAEAHQQVVHAATGLFGNIFAACVKYREEPAVTSQAIN